MDEKLEYNQQRRSVEDMSMKWQMAGSSTLSSDSKTSGTNSSPQDHLLRYIPQKEYRSQRLTIPATRLERLSYFRSCVSSPSKTQIVCMQHVKFNRFFWDYIFNLFFKSLPHTFVYIFLASYAPDEHFFLTKMLPICQGITISYIIAAVLDMTLYVDTVIQLFDYAICGLVFKNPWNRCTDNVHIDGGNGKIDRIICYDLDGFINMFKNETPAFNNTYYITANGQKFQMAPFVYYKARKQITTSIAPYGSLQIIYFIFVWLLIALHNKQLFKRYIWKVSHILHMIVNCMYLLIFIHLLLDYIFTQLEYIKDVPTNLIEIQNLLWIADVDMLAESMTTPPAVHILTARSTQEIQANRDSSVIIMSNAIYYIFKGVLFYGVKKYCESRIKAQIYLSDQISIFYFWPIYFSTIYLGDFFTILFFIFSFLTELFTLIITYQCLAEAIECEWRIANKIIVTIVLSVLSIIWFLASSEHTRLLFYIYSKALVTLMEVIGIYIIYPTGRLVEDITFHSGTIPTKLRTLSLRIVPLFYGIKVVTMLKALFEISLRIQMFNILDFFYWCLGILLIPVALGALVSAYIHIWKKKKSWKSLFRPVDDWGPHYSERHLRKLYDSRKFVGSQAPRMLSRYMMKKAESKVYNLDLPYEVYNRRSTRGSNTDSRIENEKASNR